MHNCRSRSEESIGWNEDFPAFDSERPKDYFQSAGSAIDGNCMAHPTKPRELPLKCSTVLAQRQLPARQHFLNSLGDPQSVFRQKLYFRCRNLHHHYSFPQMQHTMRLDPLNGSMPLPLSIATATSNKYNSHHDQGNSEPADRRHAFL